MRRTNCAAVSVRCKWYVGLLWPPVNARMTTERGSGSSDGMAELIAEGDTMSSRGAGTVPTGVDTEVS